MKRDLSAAHFDPATLAFGSPQESRDWYHHDEAEGLTWRILRPEDMPQLHGLWAQTDVRWGKQDKPDQFREPVVLTLVAIDDATGHIVDAIYGEAVVDWTMIAGSRRGARSVRGVFPSIAMFLFARQIRIARVLVPRRLERWMARQLPGFVDISESFAQFVYKVRD